MGSKSSAPPPNPMLEQVQIEALHQQQQIANQQLTAQQQLQPLQMEALQFGLDSQRTAYQQSQDDRAYALNKRDKYDAAMQPLIDKANNFSEADRRAELKGETDKAITDAFGDAANQQSRTLGRAGLSTDPMQTQAITQQSKMAEATARAGAGHAISAQSKNEGIQAKTDAVNMLAGYPAQATGLANTGATIGAGVTGGVNAGVGGVYGGLSAASKIFGQIGTTSAGLWGQQAKAKFTSDKAAADANSEAWGTAISVVGMAAMAMSDRRLKKDIKRIGTTADGLPLYSYTFIPTGEVEIGVMADEVEQVKPEAVFRIGGYQAVDYSQL
jgi:Chaperone of endosialidase